MVIQYFLFVEVLSGEKDRCHISLKQQFNEGQAVLDRIQDERIDQLSELINEESGETVEKAVSIEYSGLNSLIQNNKLVPGQFYRIIDYETKVIETIQ